MTILPALVLGARRAAAWLTDGLYADRPASISDVIVPLQPVNPMLPMSGYGWLTPPAAPTILVSSDTKVSEGAAEALARGGLFATSPHGTVRLSSFQL